jgi:hypothetical protein
MIDNIFNTSQLNFEELDDECKSILTKKIAANIRDTQSKRLAVGLSKLNGKFVTIRIMKV